MGSIPERDDAEQDCIDRRSKINSKGELHVWDKAGKLKLTRFPPTMMVGLKEEVMEPGVNYFIAMLEQLGAFTSWSCEGHPTGFYVVFDCTLKLARKIHCAGYFTVELETPNAFSLRLNGRYKTTVEKERTLRWAAASWESKLGPLQFHQIR